MVKVLLAALIAATLASSPLAAQEYLEGYIMLSLHKELPHPVRGLSSGGFASGLSSLDNILARHRTEVFKRFSGFTAYGRRLYKLKVPSTVNIESVLQDLRNNPNVEHAERIEILKTLLTPNDTDWANQWNFDDDHLQAEDAWDIETGSNNVILAIIDTGLDYEHPDLTQNIWRGTDTPIGLDFCGLPPRCSYLPTSTTDTDPQHEGGETHSHGTKMAGVAAAKINNMRNVAGLAGGTTNSDGVRIMGLRAGFDHAGGTGGAMPTDLYTDALEFVIAHQSRTDLSYVVNMSFATASTLTPPPIPSPNPMVQAAVTNAWNTGRIVLVAGARGANFDVRAYPAAYDNVLGVTGVTRDDVKGTNTGYGSYVDVAAPVDNVPTVAYDASPTRPSMRTPPETDPPGWPHIGWSSRGTTPSISTAQVSGLAALVWSKYPELTNEGVVHQIISTADDISTLNSVDIGEGRINAYRALTEWSGPLLVQAGETLTWSGTITITDHVTIPAGITLELEAGTEVRFQARNVNRLQLVVSGTLDASADNITFRSTNDSPTSAEWYGILVPTGGSANLSGASLQDGTRCVSNTGGTVTLTNDRGERTTTFSNCGMMPSAPHLTATGEPESVTLEWEAPNDNGGVALSHYQYSRDNSTWIGDATNPLTSPLLIDDELTNGTEYNFWVRAVNVAGIAGASASASATPVDVPEAPTLEVTPGDGQVTWRWTAGADNGSAFTGHEWRQSADGGTSWDPDYGDEDTPPQDEDQVIMGLTNGTEYTFQMRSENGEGYSDTTEGKATPKAAISGPAMVKFEENGMGMVAEYTSPYEGVTWSLGTAKNEALFRIGANSGVLTFQNPPNFEELGSDHPYMVDVIASYGTQMATLPVTVTVEDMDEPPVITAVSDDPPQVVEDTAVITGGSYTASDPDGDPVTWLAITSTGTDKDAFELTGADTDAERTLQFKADALPNYEVKNSYTVTLQVQSAPEGDGGLVQSGSLEVTVAVTNADDLGEVTLSSTAPQVGKKLIATLRDEDGQIVVDRWSWKRFPEPFGAQGTSGLAVGEYMPSAGEVGQYLRVTVYYSDGHGATKQAQSVQTEAIVDVPPAPALEAVAGDEQVALTWQAPSSDGGSPILRYKVRYFRADFSDERQSSWSVVPGGAAAQDTTIGGLTNGTAYLFRLLAENGVGNGARAEKTATPEAPSCPITGPPKPTVAENTPTTEAVATYTISGDDCGAAEWLTLGGTDASAFALQGSGTSRTLHFVTAPNYETKRSYQVTVRLQVGSAEVLLPVSVLVSNVDEAGTVAVSPPVARVGHSLTATLTDLDGQVTGASWTWEREEGATWVTVWPSGASGTAAESYPELSSYKPQTADIGHRLRARVS